MLWGRKPFALQSGHLKQRLGTGCRSRRHGGVPSWSLALHRAKVNPHLTKGDKADSFFPWGSAGPFPNVTHLGEKQCLIFSPGSSPVPTALQRHQHDTDLVPESRWLKGKNKEEKSPFNTCRYERHYSSTPGFDGWFFYFSVFDVRVAVNSVRNTGLGNRPLLMTVNNTGLGFVLV